MKFRFFMERKVKYPECFCECGWTIQPGQGIKCDDPQRGPFYCPDCSQRLAESDAYPMEEIRA